MAAETLMMFPGNYTWSAAARGAIAGSLWGGSELGEVYKVCAALADRSGDGKAWFTEWRAMGEKVAALADAARAAGSLTTAAASSMRAANYMQIGERLLQPRTDESQRTYARAVELFRQGIAHVPFLSIAAVEVPFEGGRRLPGYFVKAAGAAATRWPTVVFFDGLDITKEMQYFRGVPELIKRGLACLIVDIPGTGEAIRFRGMPARHDTEAAGRAAVDYLETRGDVDPGRLGVMAISLGGYYAPRVAAFEKRFKACVAWGAIWDYHATWKRRVEQAFNASLSVPGEHITWVLGVGSVEEALKKLEGFRLQGVAEKIDCAFLLTHGEADAQIPMEDARSLFDAVGSKDKTLRIFTRQEGGAEHCQGDNLTIGIACIADWLADRLGARPA
ncbi:MAG: prolyl oligopeptidase family serine peptidase [Candidatus Rokubacteria bacterium]|nr:prolyl oligopeptidase family serine peptidase [Candidatus Rokubacteria bacterium]